VARIQQGREDPPRGAGRDLRTGGARDSRHEPHGLPEGRLLEPLPLLPGPGHPSAQARGRAGRGQVRGDLVGAGAQRGRRRNARRHRGPGRGVDHHPVHAGARRRAGAPVLRRAGPAQHRRQRGVPGLQPRLAPHLGPLQPHRQHGRLVPCRSHPDLARESGVHEHALVPLRRRVPVQRRRGGDHRAGLQPVRDPRRLPPAGAHRHRRRPRPGHVSGDHRGGALQEAVRPGADRPAAAGALASCAAPTSWRATATTSSSGGTFPRAY